MRIFNWVQSKIHGKQQAKKFEPAYLSAAARFHSPPNAGKEEEFSDWPHGLLAIGMLGNSTAGLKGDRHNDDVPATPPPGPSSSEPQDATVVEQQQEEEEEEVDRLQKELARLLLPGVKPGTAGVGKSWSFRTSPDDGRRRRPTGLEIEVAFSGDGGELSPIRRRVVLSGGKDGLGENRIGALNQRSVSFLLKKVFSGRRGFPMAPSLRDPLQSSVMEKLLKATVHKKTYPQNRAPVSRRKKQVLDEQIQEGTGSGGSKAQRADKPDGGSRWDRTDSEFIILEI